MRKSIRRIVCLTAAILVLFSLAPVPARAVDPVSAATMANALAQAVTAYGASQGVSMMYDVTDTNSIGEGVHDLWEQFKADINDNDVPTYDSLAVTTWSTIYKKVGNSVAINLSETTVSYLDRFWNWLLSGPAEMEKVDNQYYEWAKDPVTNTIPPVSLISNSYIEVNGFKFVPLPYELHYTYNNDPSNFITNTISPLNGSMYFISDEYNTYTVSFASGASYRSTRYQSSLENTSSVDVTLKQKNQYLWSAISSGTNIGSYILDGNLPNTDSLFDLNTFASSLNASTEYNPSDDSISVLPYVGAANPTDRVYIPDNDDVNYQPLPYVGPLNIPWQNEWGDGNSLDDAGSKGIADALDQQIVDDGTLELEGDNTVNPPIDDAIGGPDDYQVPGLADVFPFCIPFDIYNFLSALAAEPAAPHFQAQLDFPEAVGGTQVIDLDFDTPTFNQLAQLLRLLELLAFIVGLALLTRSMFIRG